MGKVIPLTDRQELRVHFACNDPDSGNFAGEFGMVEFCSAHDGETLVSISGNEISLQFITGFVVVHGVPYVKAGHDQWVGNWCWDAVRMPVSTAQLLLKLLLLRGWQLEEWISDPPLISVIEEHAREVEAHG